MCAPVTQKYEYSERQSCPISNPVTVTTHAGVFQFTELLQAMRHSLGTSS